MLLDRADRDIYNAKLLLSPEGNPTNDELLDDSLISAGEEISEAIGLYDELRAQILEEEDHHESI